MPLQQSQDKAPFSWKPSIVAHYSPATAVTILWRLPDNGGNFYLLFLQGHIPFSTFFYPEKRALHKDRVWANGSPQVLRNERKTNCHSALWTATGCSGLPHPASAHRKDTSEREGMGREGEQEGGKRRKQAPQPSLICHLAWAQRPPGALPALESSASFPKPAVGTTAEPPASPSSHHPVAGSATAALHWGECSQSKLVQES